MNKARFLDHSDSGAPSPEFDPAKTPSQSQFHSEGTTDIPYFNPDHLADQSPQVVVVSWISKPHRGMYQSVYNWAVQGGGGPDTDTQKKAVECLKLLKPLEQPGDLPESANQIVTLRGFDGQKTLEKKFPIDLVPPEVHQILSLMGCGSEQLGRLKFNQNPGSAAA